MWHIEISMSKRTMKQEEKMAEDYLKNCGYSTNEIEFEPDGSVPPDFLVQKTIAVEVRRLNQYWTSPDGEQVALEEEAIPVEKRLLKILGSYGAPTNGVSWYVFWRIKRPFLTKNWEATVKPQLQKLQSGGIKQSRYDVIVNENFRIEFIQIKPRATTFVHLGESDHDRGGWVHEELQKNIAYCIDEKDKKIAPYIAKYPQWWLVLVDFIVDGRPAEGETLKLLHPNWDRVVVIHPVNYDRAYDV